MEFPCEILFRVLILKMKMGISWCKYIIHEKGVVNICPPYILNDPYFDTPLIAILISSAFKKIHLSNVRNTTFMRGYQVKIIKICLRLYTA